MTKVLRLASYNAADFLISTQQRVAMRKEQTSNAKHHIAVIRRALDDPAHIELFILANRQIATAILTLWALGYKTANITSFIGGPMTDELVESVIKQHLVRLRLPLLKFLFNISGDHNVR